MSRNILIIDELRKNKVMKKRFLKLKSWLLISMAGLLGIPLACDRPLEYGTPEATYRVKGTVFNTEGHPVAGIGVNLRYLNDRPSNLYQDTTDSDGCFVCSMRNFPNIDTIKMDMHDTDGSIHGSYQDTTVNVLFSGATFSGGDGHWYKGEATREVEIELQYVDE